MELKTFTQMFSDKDGLNFIKLRYKYGNESLAEYIEIYVITFISILICSILQVVLCCYCPLRLILPVRRLLL